MSAAPSPPPREAPPPLRVTASASVAASLFGGALNLLAVPLYVHYLGIESYALVGVALLAQALLGLTDLGMGPTLGRMLAGASSPRQVAPLLYAFERAYWCIAGVFVLAVMLVAGTVADGHLSPQRLPSSTVAAGVKAAAVMVAAQWPFLLYSAGLQGLQRHAWLSGVQTVGHALRHGGGLLVAITTGSVVLFLGWTACVNATLSVVTRWRLWRELGGGSSGPMEWGLLRQHLSVARVMGPWAVVNGLLLQFDRMLASRWLSLADFGVYSLTWTLGNGLYLLIAPLFQSVYPALANLQAGDPGAVSARYRRATEATTVLVVPTALVLGMFSRDVLALWTRDPALSAQGAAALTAVAAGVALHATMHLPQALQFATGRVGVSLPLLCVALAIFWPVASGFTARWGLPGPAIAWAGVNAGLFLSLPWVVHRVLLPGASPVFYLSGVLKPALAASAGIAVAWLVLPHPGEAWLPGALRLGALLAAGYIGAGLAVGPVRAALRAAWTREA